MNEGQLVGEFSRDEATEEHIMRLALPLGSVKKATGRDKASAGPLTSRLGSRSVSS